LRGVLSLVSRAGLAGSLALLLLALGRLRPIYAASALDVPSLPTATAALAFGIVAALTGGARAPGRWRGIAGLVAATAILLAIVVALRGQAGLPATVSDGSAVVGHVPAGPIDLIARDLRGIALRRANVDWAGELRLPASGRFRLWVEGVGSASLSVAGRPLLLASGSPFRREAEIVLGRGPTTLELRFEQRGPGPRVRFGWTRPDGRREVVPPRQLGPARSAWWWRATDVLVLALGLLTGLVAFLAPWDAPRLPRAPSTVRAREVALTTLGYVALVALMSWPLARDLVHSGPLYRPDGRLNAWILAWAGHALWHEPTRLFQAPTFHPLPDTLAFSENMLLPAALAAPFTAAGGAVLGYNLVLIASLVLSGLATYLLVRRAGGDPLAAFVGGAYFAAGPHRWLRLTHIQAQLTVFLPLALLALDRFWERRTLRRALLVGVLLAAQGLSSVYLGVITAAVLAVAIAVALLGGLGARELLRLSAGFLLAGILLAPAARPYFRTRAFLGQEFSLADVSGAATNLVSYAAAGTAFWGPITQRQLGLEPLSDALFPGLVVLLLGVAGLAVAPRRYRAVALAASAMAIFFSLGPETALYRWLHEHVVVVRVVRVLSRFALVPALALAVLAGLALSGRRRLTCLAALAAILVESANVPLRLERYDGPSPAAQWLAGRPGAVAYLPVGDDSTRAMLDGLAHLRPLVNGNGAFMPRPFDRALEMLGGGALDEEALRFLRAVAVRHVVAGPTLALPERAVFGDEHVYEVTDGPAAQLVTPGDPAATLWTEQGAVIDLGRPRRVSGVVFELDDREWRMHPLIQSSADGLDWRPLEARASLADATLSLYRDPRHARGALSFAPLETRFLRLDPELPARRGVLETRP
jgi:hypothetical protein